MQETNYSILGLNRIFPEDHLLEWSKKQGHVIAVLSYFATSLFDKNKVGDVLWDIAENCISRLGMEDCVIYLMSKDRKMLVQKAAYGHKRRGKHTILQPITIPYGKGIVGHVAASGKAEIVDDVTTDTRYILDDKQRGSELTVPMILEDEVIGVIDSEHSEKHFFTVYHRFLFELIAQLAVKKLAHILRKHKASFTNDNAYYRQFDLLLEKEKIYKDGNLSQAAVAERLHISTNYLSQLVNAISGHNFSELINSCRVKEAMRCLHSPDFSHFTVTGIGHESGFNSKSAFYTAFKKETSISPAAYRAKAPHHLRLHGRF